MNAPQTVSMLLNFPADAVGYSLVTICTRTLIHLRSGSHHTTIDRREMRQGRSAGSVLAVVEARGTVELQSGVKTVYFTPLKVPFDQCVAVAENSV